MNRKLLNFLLEGLGAVFFVVLVGMLDLEGLTGQLGWPLALGLFPLVWLGLRYSAAASIVAAALAGLILALIHWGLNDIVAGVLWEVTPLLVVGISGFFAKYTQKTLNNRRYSSTYLNIGTASFLVSAAYFILKYVLMSQIVSNQTIYSLLSSQLWLGIVLTTLVMASILIGGARLNDKLIIPKRSPYLSRKETSRLLND